MSKYLKYFFFFGFIIVFAACKKKTPPDIGLPLLPGQDVLSANFTDSSTVITHTQLDDSIFTRNVYPTLVGNINDPIFGITKASLFAQVSLSTLNPIFGPNPVLDSAVLSLVYSISGNYIQYYGNYNSPQKFDVYELSDTLGSTTLYYSNKTKPYYSTQQIGSAVIIPPANAAADTVPIILPGDTEKYAAHIRINLSKEMFQNFLTNPTYTGTYNDNPTFQNTFKGIYFVSSSMPASGQGSILKLSLGDNFSRIALYYHNDNHPTRDTAYYFNFKSTTYFSHFEHDYSMTSDIPTQITTSVSVQESKVYVQSMAGLRTKITLPYITDLFKNKKVAINQAELIMPVDAATVTDTNYSAPPQLFLSDSGRVIIPDYYEGSSYFGGTYDATNKQYIFNVARYVQQVLTDKRKNTGLYIIATSPATTANRVVLLGGDKMMTSRMRLKISYTPLK